MDDDQIAAKTLVESMLEATGLTATELARRAGLTPSTLTRFMNKPVKHSLSARTLAKLTSAAEGALSNNIPSNHNELASSIASESISSGAEQDLERDALWFSWARLREHQRQVVGNLMSVMIEQNENGISHEDNPKKSRTK